MTDKTALSILAEVQQKLKAPKGQINAFGKYKYRSCEDIVEAVKPLLAEYGAALVISDELVLIGDRYYIKATAAICSLNDSVASSAYARESLDKKGMDVAQITGSTSSYARKYALNGLFAIDDTKDADTQDNRTKVPEKPAQITTGVLASRLANCKTLADLSEIWKGLNPQERATHSELKDTIKAKIG